MRHKIIGFGLGALLLALCPSAEAQQSKNASRIGYLSNNPGSGSNAFRDGLRELGYTEGKNILIEYRHYEGKLDRIESLVAELVQLKVDVLVCSQLRGIRPPSSRPNRFLLSW
jgi:putative ABC transport system substrate-binding protein